MKEITTNGITILFVEVPEDATWFQIMPRQGIVNECLRYNFGTLRFGIKYEQLPSGQYQILGKSTELSEEQKEEICDQVSSFGKMYWKNYLLPMSFTDGFTVQESYLSLLEANGIVDRNPYEKPDADKILDEYSCNENVIAKMVYREDLEQWQEAQSKVKHYLVLERI